MAPCPGTLGRELYVRRIHARRGFHLNRRFLLTAVAVLAAFAPIVALTAAQTSGHTTTTQSVLAMMDKSASDFRSLTADLENTKYTDVVKDSSVETGHIYVRRDQKMRIE